MNEEHGIMIKKLREETGLPLMKCKQAFHDADADYDKALKLIKDDDEGRYSGVQRLVTRKPIGDNESEEIKMCGGESMYGKCGVCGKEGPLTRTYFRYKGINCECCSPEHSELVDHHIECIPKEPRYTKVSVKTEDLKHPVAMAMNILTDALVEDKTPGSYYYSWQANIACTIMDNSNIEHDKANEIAIKFLDLLIGNKEKEIDKKIYIFQNWKIFSQSIEEFNEWDVNCKILKELDRTDVYHHTDDNHDAFMMISFDKSRLVNIMKDRLERTRDNLDLNQQLYNNRITDLAKYMIDRG